MSDTTVLIVGGGFAGVACAQLLAKHDVDVIMLDRNNYHQFQPMLYQVATAQLAADDIARPLRGIFRHDKTVEVRHTAVTSIDLDARSVTTTLGSVLSADYLVIAVGAQANFFGTPGAAEHSLPLYSVNDAERLRTRILEVLDATTERPELIEMGAHRHEVDGPVAFAAWPVHWPRLSETLFRRAINRSRNRLRCTLSIMVRCCWHRSRTRRMPMPPSDCKTTASRCIWASASRRCFPIGSRSAMATRS